MYKSLTLVEINQREIINHLRFLRHNFRRDPYLPSSKELIRLATKDYFHKFEELDKDARLEVLKIIKENFKREYLKNKNV